MPSRSSPLRMLIGCQMLAHSIVVIYEYISLYKERKLSISVLATITSGFVIIASR